MTDETKKLFDAPWKVRVCEKGNPEFESILVAKKTGWLVGRDMEYKTAKRVARLPELYDALLHCICSSCNVCIYDHCDSPVDCEQLLSQECTYEDSKLCFEHEARKLLKKVRDGE